MVQDIQRGRADRGHCANGTPESLSSVASAARSLLHACPHDILVYAKVSSHQRQMRVSFCSSLLLSPPRAPHQNVSGRMLVGLRYWNYTTETGENDWQFESRDPEARPRPSLAPRGVMISVGQKSPSAGSLSHLVIRLAPASPPAASQGMARVQVEEKRLFWTSLYAMARPPFLCSPGRPLHAACVSRRRAAEAGPWPPFPAQPAVWTLFALVSLIKFSLGYLLLCIVRSGRGPLLAECHSPCSCEGPRAAQSAPGR